MKTEIIEYINVRDKIKVLSLNEISGLAFLPYNLRDANLPNDFLYDDSLKVVSKLFKHNNINISRIEQDTSETKYYQENDITWLGPTIFIAYSLWTENPNLIAIGLSVIANYLTDFFKGKSSSPRVKINYVVEKDPKKGKINVHFSYDGDIEGLKEIPKILTKLKDE